MRDVLATVTKLDGELHPHVAEVYLAMSTIAHELDEPKEAFKYAKKAISVWRKIEGHSESVGYVMAVLHLGVLCRKFSLVDLALRLGQFALAALQARLGAGHPLVSQAYFHLAAVYLQRGMTAEAEGAIAKATEILAAAREAAKS